MRLTNCVYTVISQLENSGGKILSILLPYLHSCTNLQQQKDKFTHVHHFTHKWEQLYQLNFPSHSCCIDIEFDTKCTSTFCQQVVRISLNHSDWSGTLYMLHTYIVFTTTTTMPGKTPHLSLALPQFQMEHVTSVAQYIHLLYLQRPFHDVIANHCCLSCSVSHLYRRSSYIILLVVELVLDNTESIERQCVSE